MAESLLLRDRALLARCTSDDIVDVPLSGRRRRELCPLDDERCCIGCPSPAEAVCCCVDSFLAIAAATAASLLPLPDDNAAEPGFRFVVVVDSSTAPGNGADIGRRSPATPFSDKSDLLEPHPIISIGDEKRILQ